MFTKALISLYTLFAVTEFLVGQRSWRNRFAVWFALLSNMEGKCSRAISAIVPPDNLPKYCSHIITPLLCTMATMKGACRTPSLLPRAVQPIFNPLLIRFH